MRKAYAVYLAVVVPALVAALFYFGYASTRFLGAIKYADSVHQAGQAPATPLAEAVRLSGEILTKAEKLNEQVARVEQKTEQIARAEMARAEAEYAEQASAQLVRLEKALNGAFPQAPAKSTAIAAKVQPAAYYAPSCSDMGHLEQAVNPTPRGSQYKGQLLVSTDGQLGEPCLGPGEYAHATLGKVVVGKNPRKSLKPGTYAAPGGTVTILGTKPKRK